MNDEYKFPQTVTQEASTYCMRRNTSDQSLLMLNPVVLKWTLFFLALLHPTVPALVILLEYSLKLYESYRCHDPAWRSFFFVSTAATSTFSTPSPTLNTETFKNGLGGGRTQIGLSLNETARSLPELPPRRLRPLSLVQKHYGRQPRPQTAVLVQQNIDDAITNLRTWSTYWVLLLGALVTLNSLSWLSIMVIFLLDRSVWRDAPYVAKDGDYLYLPLSSVEGGVEVSSIYTTFNSIVDIVLSLSSSVAVRKATPLRLKPNPFSALEESTTETRRNITATSTGSYPTHLVLSEDVCSSSEDTPTKGIYERTPTLASAVIALASAISDSPEPESPCAKRGRRRQAYTTIGRSHLDNRSASANSARNPYLTPPISPLLG